MNTFIRWTSCFVVSLSASLAAQDAPAIDAPETQDANTPVASPAPVVAAQDAEGAAAARAAESVGDAPARPFATAAGDVAQRLADTLAELSALRESIAGEAVPLNRELRELEAELQAVRGEYQAVTRRLDGSSLDLTNLRSDIKVRQDEVTYLSNQFSEYMRNFESRLHVSELQRHAEALEAAKLAVEHGALPARAVFDAQVALLDVSLDRLDDAVGGARFPGRAVDPDGTVRDGRFVLVGPSALFASDDGGVIGTAEQRLGSLEPAVIPFVDPADSAAAQALVATGRGLFPFDATEGNAHRFEASDQETLLEEFLKGGAVMWPILALAAAALLVALFKAVELFAQRKPSAAQIGALLDDVAAHDEEGARRHAAKLRGPVGRMLAVAVDHLREPRELVEEVMYETVLATRLKLERALPFVAISAASAPLLGLLGTVTGIISTFRMITLYGSGDVKSLSGGISEALITTKYGLIVAIPSLLLHALLSRKARGIVNQMETAAVAFVNQVGRTAAADAAAARPHGDVVARSHGDESERARDDARGERVVPSGRRPAGGAARPADAESRRATSGGGDFGDLMASMAGEDRDDELARHAEKAGR